MVNATGNPSSPVAPILNAPLPSSAKNGIRKLFQENRQMFVEALMHRSVLVPEGRTDAGWLKLLSSCVATDQDLGVCGDSPPFETVFGIVPTHDACVVDTVEKIKDIRGDVIVLVDGDDAGDGYVKALLKSTKPPERVVQWPAGFEMEDIVGWILEKDQMLVQSIQAEVPSAPGSIPEIVAWLKRPSNEKGAKTDFIAHEAIGAAVMASNHAKSRIRNLFEAFVELTSGRVSSKLVSADSGRSTNKTAVWRMVLEP